ncbi:class I SAM-dependent methyltransferase [bacterium]|nr:class I SAM-dependent methyltransferase [bacterium]
MDIQTEKLVVFEQTNCLICSETNSEEKFSYRDEYGRYAVVRCRACGFHFLNPRPTQTTIGVYYAADTYTPFLSSSDHEDIFTKLYRAIRRYSVAWKRNKIENYFQNGSALDLGCGTGEFLSEMKRHGWQVAGIEPSPEAASFAREKLQLNVVTGTIDSEIAQDQTFDVITMWHVLEHVHDAERALHNISEKLKPEGILAIAVPNINSFDASVYGSEWIALDPPRHLYHFTPQSMTALLQRARFSVVATKQIPLDTIFNCLMSEIKIIRKRSLIIAPFLGLRLAAVCWWSLIYGWTGKRSSTVLFFAKKNNHVKN